MNNSAYLVLTTCPSHEEAMQIAKILVEQQLAACVNIIPAMTSVYRWQDEVQHEQECQLLIKTQHRVLDELHDCVMEWHPYDVPEWLIIEISNSLADDLSGTGNAYLKWLNDSIKK